MPKDLLAEKEQKQSKRQPKDLLAGIQPPPQSEPPPAESSPGFLSQLGSGAYQLGVGGVKGMAGLGDVAASLATYIPRVGYETLTGTQPKTVTETLLSPIAGIRPFSSALDYTGILPEPESKGEEFLQTVGSFAAPGGILGKAGKLGKIAGAGSGALAGTGSFAGGEIAERIDPSLRPYGEIAGALGTDIARIGAGRLAKEGKDLYKAGLTKSGLKEYPTDKAAKRILNPDNLSPEYLKERAKTASERVKAGKELGVELTPGEAFESPTISKSQAELGRTPKGQAVLEEFYRKPGGRYEAENKAVKDFFKELGVTEDKISPDTARKVRDVANEILAEQTKTRQTRAEPYYKKAFEIDMPRESVKKILGDEVIDDIAKKVYKKPVYKQAIKSKDLKSGVEFFQPIKETLDDQIAVARRAGENNLASRLMKSKNNLLNELDNISPDYRTARKIFYDESTVLDDLKKTNLGKIANLKDEQLKNVSKILFDPKEIDSKTRGIVTSKLLNQNKDLYYQALSENMLNKMDTLTSNATNRKAPAFYKSILATDKDYNFYREALKNNKNAQKRLDAMRTAFKDLGGDFTPKSITQLEKTSMLNKRNMVDAALEYLKNPQSYDIAAIKFITDPDWIKQVDKLIKTTPKKSLSSKVMDKLKQIAKEDLEKLGTDVLRTTASQQGLKQENETE